MGWAKGDGALLGHYPEFCYRDAAPNSAELLVGCMLLAVITAAVWAVTGWESWRWAAEASLLGAVMVPPANMLAEIHRHVAAEPRAMVPGMQGGRRVAAAAEGALIRVASELGRLLGMWQRGELPRLLLW